MRSPVSISLVGVALLLSAAAHANSLRIWSYDAHSDQRVHRLAQ